MWNPNVIDPAQVTSSKIFVGGLTYQVTEEDLYQYFKLFCPVTDIAMPTAKDDPTRKGGYAIVTLNSPADALRVLQYTHFIDRRQVDVKTAIEKNQKTAYKVRIATKKVWFEWRSARLNCDDLKAAVAKYGKIDDWVLFEAREKNKGGGFVIFKEERSVVNILRDEDKFYVNGKKLNIKFYRSEKYVRDNTKQGHNASLSMNKNQIPSGRKCFQNFGKQKRTTTSHLNPFKDHSLTFKSHSESIEEENRYRFNLPTCRNLSCYRKVLAQDASTFVIQLKSIIAQDYAWH